MKHKIKTPLRRKWWLELSDSYGDRGVETFVIHVKVDGNWGLRDREALGFWLVKLGSKEYQMGKKP